jgi:4-alpha-glucanotransferase
MLEHTRLRKFQLTLIIHAHQPVGNFDDVIERAYSQSYLPFLETLAQHPAICIGMHFSGSLLEWIERSHPGYFDRLQSLIRNGQIELVGGGFYEPILVAIPTADRLEQITRLSDYLERHLGVRPRGAWLAERVWEPHLPSTLAPAGIEYTLVDDNHFLGAGFDPEQMYGYYVAEDQGSSVKVLPGLRELRYLVPFRNVGETTDFLHVAAVHPGGFAAMGDDLEKFGSWPGTHELCYRQRWLDNFFTEIESNSSWLETVTPSAAIAAHAPLGRADLPAASYSEMMEWSLPTSARSRFHALTEEFITRPDAKQFLRGGIWRSFLSKYPESNLLHKKMLNVSRKVHDLERSHRQDPPFIDAREKTQTLLLRGQCNDPYWHGVFGGLYAPHLRTALWRSLQEAEAIADGLSHVTSEYQSVSKFDFDADAHDELYFTSHRFAALLKPSDGATIPAIDCRQSHVALINAMARRREPYHASLKDTPSTHGPTAHTIHNGNRAKEDGLGRFLHYDRWARNCFRLLVFGREKSHLDCATATLNEDAAVASGSYKLLNFSREGASLASEGATEWAAEKSFVFAVTPGGFDITCEATLRRDAEGSGSAYVGIETVMNFLAPDAPDRYFEFSGERFPLRWSSAAVTSELLVVDEAQKIRVALSAPDAKEFWITPIETVSESEEGYERVYQGSQIIAVWPADLVPASEARFRLIFSVTRID